MQSLTRKQSFTTSQEKLTELLLLLLLLIIIIPMSPAQRQGLGRVGKKANQYRHHKEVVIEDKLTELKLSYPKTNVAISIS